MSALWMDFTISRRFHREVQKQVEDKITKYGNGNSKEIEKSNRRFYGFK